MKNENNINNTVPYNCTPGCMYFPNMECNEWVYDDNDPNIKRRKEPKRFMCGYDGHEIVSWYDNLCPKNISSND